MKIEFVSNDHFAEATVAERGDNFRGLHVGGRVIVEGECGWHKAPKVVALIGPIQTKQYEANTQVILVDMSDDTYDDMTEAEQDEAWDDLPHAAISE